MELVGFIVFSIIGISMFGVLGYKEFKPTARPEVIHTDGNTEVIKRRSNAFVTGYKDMLRYGLDYNTTFVEPIKSGPYDYILRSSHSSWDSAPTTTIYYDKDGTPKLENTLWKILAKSVLDKTRTIDVDAGQCSRTYLGGSEEEFADYYAGGMYFLEKLDGKKQEVIDEKIAEENRDRLIDSRKKGLSENNRQIVLNMEALDELRTTTFKPWEEASDRQN